MFFIWAKFIICTLIILFAGRKVAKYGDIIAEKTGLGGVWIGLFLLAIATSLPEIFTGVGSIIFIKDPNLTVGNLFGANTYNLLNIAILDFFNKGAPLLSMVGIGQLLLSGLTLIPLAIAALGIFLSNIFSIPSIANISIFSILILISYLFIIRKIFVFEKKQERDNTASFKYKNITLRNAFLFYGISALAIILAGIWLAYIGDGLAKLLKLDSSFIGTLFLGFTTTLPEIVVSIAALRLGARDMAVANMLGSNLFNITIIFINDILYRRAPIFVSLSVNHLFTCLVIFLMTILVIFAIAFMPKRKPSKKLNWFSFGIIAIFIAGVYANFKISEPKILVIDDFEGEISSMSVDYGAGSGSQIQVGASKEIKYYGEQAIRVEYEAVSGSYMWLARGYRLDVKGADRWLEKPTEIDWSKYQALSFYMYGENSGAMLAVDIIDQEFEYFRFIVKDDFSGWKKIVCPFDKFFARGDWQPAKAQTNAKLDFPVHAFQFEPRPIAKGILYFDYVHLIKRD